MDVTEDQKNEVGMQLTRRIGQLLEEKNITLDEAKQIAEFILARIDGAESQEDMLALVDDLHHDWPYFESIQKIASVPSIAAADLEKAEKVADLIKENKVDEAIASAK